MNEAPIDEARRRARLLGESPIAEVPVTVRLEPVPGDARWQIGGWRVAEVQPAAGDEPGAMLVFVFRDEAEGYYLNISAPEPSIFVMWREESGESAPRPVSVTFSYNEAARWMDAGESVDRVPMPGEVVEWLGEVVRLHYRPEKKRKRRGDKPSFMSREELERMAERERAGGAADAAGAGETSPREARDE